jgi:hypothetical protein
MVPILGRVTLRANHLYKVSPRLAGPATLEEKLDDDART